MGHHLVQDLGVTDLCFSPEDCCDVNEVADVGADGTPLSEGPLTLSW